MARSFSALGISSNQYPRRGAARCQLHKALDLKGNPLKTEGNPEGKPKIKFDIFEASLMVSPMK